MQKDERGEKGKLKTVELKEKTKGEVVEKQSGYRWQILGPSLKEEWEKKHKCCCGP